MVRRLLLTGAGLSIIAGCATLQPPAPGYERVSVRALAAHPERWDGKEVELRGLAVSEFENFGVYASYAEYCDGPYPHDAVYAEWREGGGKVRGE